MSEKKYIFDLRVGCVAVYEVPKLNCLSLPREAFLYYRNGSQDENGDWQVDQKYINEAKMIANALNKQQETKR
jgi:hypothetical protein